MTPLHSRLFSRKYAIVWLFPTLLLLGLLFQNIVIAVARFIADHIFFCAFYEMSGRYCMGCGCTRSVMALLHGDIAAAFHNNPAPFVGIAAFLLFYTEKCAGLLGKKLRLLPRKMWFWMTLFTLQFIWNIFRNLIPEMAPVSL